ncbi:hypothetical protein J3F83DRAFT_742032 [Trichoderma novae-zelandiae]
MLRRVARTRRPGQLLRTPYSRPRYTIQVQAQLRAWVRTPPCASRGPAASKAVPTIPASLFAWPCILINAPCNMRSTLGPQASCNRQRPGHHGSSVGPTPTLRRHGTHPGFPTERANIARRPPGHHFGRPKPPRSRPAKAILTGQSPRMTVRTAVALGRQSQTSCPLASGGNHLRNERTERDQELKHFVDIGPPRQPGPT